MQDTVRAAEGLLGCYLLREINGKKLIGRIVETEAYLGIRDPSCHSFKSRRTKRTETMYLPGGYSYVYFTYGMYHCFNVVTGNTNQPEAVLIRALEPVQGLPEMKKNRKRDQPTELCSGPGKLCQALEISRSLNAKDLSREGSIYISKGGSVPGRGSQIKTTEVEMDSRIGLPLHEDSSYWFLRFYLKNSPFVSVRKNQVS